MPGYVETFITVPTAKCPTCLKWACPNAHAYRCVVLPATVRGARADWWVPYDELNDFMLNDFMLTKHCGVGTYGMHGAHINTTTAHNLTTDFLARKPEASHRSDTFRQVLDQLFHQQTRTTACINALHMRLLTTPTEEGWVMESWSPLSCCPGQRWA